MYEIVKQKMQYETVVRIAIRDLRIMFPIKVPETVLSLCLCSMELESKRRRQYGVML